MAEPKRYELRVPPDKTTWATRLAFATAAREKLRQEHNAKGADYRAGRITRAEWDDYVNNTFRPRSAAISNAINDLRMHPPAVDLGEVDLARDIREEALAIGREALGN